MLCVNKCKWEIMSLQLTAVQTSFHNQQNYVRQAGVKDQGAGGSAAGFALQLINIGTIQFWTQKM